MLETLAATNPFSESDVGATYYSIDDPVCTKDALNNCLVYSAPIRKNEPTLTRAGTQFGSKSLAESRFWVGKGRSSHASMRPVFACIAVDGFHGPVLAPGIAVASIRSMRWLPS